MTQPENILLVTGCPRSGTTAVGNLLAAAPRTRYLYEPFNFHTGDRRIKRYFEIPGTPFFPNDLCDQLIEDIRHLKLTLRAGPLPEDRGIMRMLKTIVGGRTRFSYRVCKWDPFLKTMIWKDPLAAFAARTVAMHHHIPVLFTVRDAHAIAASFKRLGWSFDLEDINHRLQECGLGEPELISSHQKHLANPAINGAILWRLIYRTALRAAESTDNIHFAHIDHIVENPLPSYQRLYRLLNLQWTDNVRRQVEETYAPKQAQSAVPKSMKAHDRNRDLGQLNRYGEHLLTDEEKAAITEIAGDLNADLSAASR